MISLCFFPLPPVNRREALRYAGAKAETPELSLLLDAVLADITPHLQGKVCWIDTPIRRQGETLDLGFAKTNSAALARNLVGCDRAVVFAATLGLEFDRVLQAFIYAPQTFEAPDGRRILFGWAGVTDSPYDNEPSIQEGWQYSMTVPRELSWKGDILCQNPARELEALRKEEVAFGNGEAEIDGGAFDLVAERGTVGDEACEMDKTGAEPTGKQETSDKKEPCGDIPVRICLNEDLQITYEQGVVSMEFLNNTGSGRTIRKAKLDSFQNVRILMDVSLVEVYFNDGELVMTTRYYPEDPAKTKVSISGMEQVKCWKN